MSGKVLTEEQGAMKINLTMIQKGKKKTLLDNNVMVCRSYLHATRACHK